MSDTGTAQPTPETQSETPTVFDQMDAKAAEQPPEKRQTCPRRMNDFGPWKREENLDYWREDNTCSFCGSLHPDRFLEAAKAGAQLGPTDKNYKVYVATAEKPHGKFYFMHLSEDQKREFVELMNSGTLKIEMPGHFYVLPFFCQREAPIIPPQGSNPPTAG